TPEQRQASLDAEAAVWTQTESRLGDVLAEAATDTGLREEERRRFGASATELEIQSGALADPDAHEHVFAFFRTIDDLPAHAEAASYLDLAPDGTPDHAARVGLDELKGRL